MVKNGVPWDVANTMDAEERAALVVIFGRMEGGDFDWSSRSWRKPHA
jgi:hypothetical protein